MEAGARGARGQTRSLEHRRVPWWTIATTFSCVADDTSGSGYFKNFGKTRRQGVRAGRLSSQIGPICGRQLHLSGPT